MLQANLVTTYLQLLGAAESPQRADPPTASQPFPQLSPGAALSALIVAQLGPGLYLAEIDGRRVQLNIPAPVAPGEQVLLRMLRNAPVPVFDLIRPDTVEQNWQPSFSGAAELIRSVLADPAPANEPPAAPPLAEGPTSAGGLADALRAAVAQCGVFYESHLRAWAGGKRTLAELHREPQASWSAASAHQTDGPLGATTIPEEGRPILRHQLEALEHNRITWSGLVWPEHNATLTIAEDASPRDDQSVEPVWRTSISLQLPRLGDVRADLSLCRNALAITLDCGVAQTAERMRAGLPLLRAWLEAAGFQQSDLNVSRHAAG